LGSRPEVRKERSDRMHKRFSDPEQRKAQSERTKKHMSVPGNHPASKVVINTETGEIFASARHLSNLLGCNIKWVTNRTGGVIRNDTHYRYLEDVESGSERGKFEVLSSEERSKIASEAAKKWQAERPYKNHKCVRVINSDTGEIFGSITALSKSIGVNYDELKNKIRKGKGYPYRYLEDKKTNK